MKSQQNRLFIADIFLSCFITIIVFLTAFRDISSQASGYTITNWLWISVAIVAGGAWCVIYGARLKQMQARLPWLRNSAVAALGISFIVPRSLLVDTIEVALAIACSQLLLVDINNRLRNGGQLVPLPLVATIVALVVGCTSFWIESGIYTDNSIFTRLWLIYSVLVFSAVVIVAAIIGKKLGTGTQAQPPAASSASPNAPLVKAHEHPVPYTIATMLATLALATLLGIYLAANDAVTHNLEGVTSYYWLILVNALVIVGLVGGTLIFKGPGKSEPHAAINRKKWLVFWAIAAISVIWFVPYVWKRIDFNNRTVPFKMNISVLMIMLYVLPAIGTWLLHWLVNVQYTGKLLALASITGAAGLLLGCTGYQFAFKGTGQYLLPAIAAACVVLGLLGGLYLDIGGAKPPANLPRDVPLPPRFEGNFTIFALGVCIGIQLVELYFYINPQPLQAEIRTFLLFPVGFIAVAVLASVGSKRRRLNTLLVLIPVCIFAFIFSWFIPTVLFMTCIIPGENMVAHVASIFTVPAVAGLLFSQTLRYRLSAKDVGMSIFSAAFGVVAGWAGYNVMRWREDLYLQLIAFTIVLLGFITCWFRANERDIVRPVIAITKGGIHHGQ
nr:hypothetical protein [Candidatus Sigynarchaeota archaeon]